jgi:hypothetical protein
MSDNIIKAESAIQTSGNPENPSDAVNPEAGMKKPQVMPKGKKKKKSINKEMHGETGMQEMISEGDFVMGMTSEGMIHGMVEHIMIEGGVYGVPGTEYAIQSMPPENPAMAVRIYEEEDGKWEPTAYSIGMMYKDAELIDINNHTMEEEDDMDSEVAMAMYDSSIGKSHSCNSSSSVNKAYEGCGCPTCKELNVNCDNCPVCQMDKADMTDTKDCKCNGCMECKAAGGCDMEMCKGHDNMYKSEDLSDEEISKSYHSDDEEMDKWDNIQKACWVGYEQQGMKEKDGRMVPNCVYVGKSDDMLEDDMEKAKKPNYAEFIQPRRGGSTPSNPRLYARVVQAAKDKFEVYPSAVANSWVVQEYKRRGGTYKSEKQIDTDNFWNGFIK